MNSNQFGPVPNYHRIKESVIENLVVYWPNEKLKNSICSLPVAHILIENIELPLKLVEIEMPKWASQASVNQKMLVPQECVNKSNAWEDVDWFMAAFLMLESVHERKWEHLYGSINSYSFRLEDWDSRIWDYAWVNRIAIFLVNWAQQINSFSYTIPKSKIFMTHDIDALERNMLTILKRSGFLIFNFLFFPSSRRTIQLARLRNLLVERGTWNHFREITEIEKKANIKSIFFAYSHDKHRYCRQQIIDPVYTVAELKASGIFDLLKNSNFQIGIHSSSCIKNHLSHDIEILSNHLNQKVDKNRNHWLRFSWSSTWEYLQEAGISEDSTLMFNDRPGFRNSSAISWKPWNWNRNEFFQISAVSTVLMDSHYYDYANNFHATTLSMEHIINEIAFVGGYAYVLWHPHTLGEAFGWRDGFMRLCKLIANSQRN